MGKTSAGMDQSNRGGLTGVVQSQLTDLSPEEQGTSVSYPKVTFAPRNENGVFSPRFGDDVLVGDIMGEIDGHVDMVSTSSGKYFIVVESMDTSGIDIYQSSDGGNTWQYYIGIGVTGSEITDPAIAVPEDCEDYMYVVYSIGWRLYLVKIDLSDKSYSVHTIEGGDESILTNPRIVTDSNDQGCYYWIYVAYRCIDTPVLLEGYRSGHACVNGGSGIIATRSLDKGENWGDYNMLGGSAGGGHVDLSYGGGNIYATWRKAEAYPAHDVNVLVSRSTDYGVSWSTGVNLCDSVSRDCRRPRVAAIQDGSEVVVVYTFEDVISNKVYYAYSTDKGTTWTKHNLLAGWPNNIGPHPYFENPDISVDPSLGDFHVIMWSDDALYRSKHYILYTHAPHDNLTNWSTRKMVNDTEQASREYTPPTVAVDWMSGEAGIAWSDERTSTNAIYFDRADWPLTYNLKVTKEGTGTGRVSSSPAGIDCGTNCSAGYLVGTVVTLTATPTPGSTFAGWSGDPDCSDGEVTMDADKTCTATFNLLIYYTLTVTKEGTGSGKVISFPGINCGTDCSEDYRSGTLVILIASPDEGSVFAGWSGDPDCSNGKVTMDADKTCTATFDLTTFDPVPDIKANGSDGPVTITSSGYFSDSGQSLGISVSMGMALGDVDGDGDLDAFIANINKNKVWFNDGSGTFTDSGQGLGDSESSGVALGDVDGDGDLDAFIVNYGEPGSLRANKVWLNNGSGTFTDSGQGLGDSESSGVALGDVDGDGDLDAFIANINKNKIWLNNGSGTFTDSDQVLGNSGSRGVALGDVDGDGDLDAFIANSYLSNANKVWFNDGSGTFTDSGQGLGNSDSFDIALGDVDSDGDPDAFIANYGVANKVWLNNGSGTFTDSGQGLGNSKSSGVALGDVDGDGDPDAFIANYGVANKVWLNNGSGTFTDSGPWSLVLEARQVKTLTGGWLHIRLSHLLMTGFITI
jgi:hypothetical protein